MYSTEQVKLFMKYKDDPIGFAEYAREMCDKPLDIILKPYRLEMSKEQSMALTQGLNYDNELKMFIMEKEFWDERDLLIKIVHQLTYERAPVIALYTDKKFVGEFMDAITIIFDSLDDIFTNLMLEGELSQGTNFIRFSNNGRLIFASNRDMLRGFAIKHLYVHNSIAVDEESIACLHPTMTAVKGSTITYFRVNESKLYDKLGTKDYFIKVGNATKAHPMDTFDSMIEETFYTGFMDSWTSDKLFVKINEELGEFGEAKLIDSGDINNKELKEPSIGEVCDVINTTIATYAKHAVEANLYPDAKTQKVLVDQIMEDMRNHYRRKLNKYYKKLEDNK